MYIKINKYGDAFGVLGGTPVPLIGGREPSVGVFGVAQEIHGKIGINKVPMTTNQACANIYLDENIANYRYIFHFLSSQYEYIKSLGTGSQTNINEQIVKKIKVPVPSLEKQKRIVSILDKFDTLVNDISIGLPAEITARRKQYEYYRSELLTFPEYVS